MLLVEEGRLCFVFDPAFQLRLACGQFAREFASILQHTDLNKWLRLWTNQARDILS